MLELLQSLMILALSREKKKKQATAMAMAGRGPLVAGLFCFSAQLDPDHAGSDERRRQENTKKFIVR